VTHLHNDTIPKVGGDTLWASGYAAYEKLSPEFRKIIDGRQAVYRSAHPYLDRENPTAGPKYVERTHPLVRVHPATGWKALWVNRAMTSHIGGLDKAESDVASPSLLPTFYFPNVFEGYLKLFIRCLRKQCRHTAPLQMDPRNFGPMGQQDHHSQRELGL
jgi:alpha-ketoglutarate-dependent taurine dioxygenase